MDSATRTAPTYGDYAEVLAGEHRGLVGRVRATLPAAGAEPERVRLTVQGGRSITVPLADVQKV